MIGSRQRRKTLAVVCQHLGNVPVSASGDQTRRARESGTEKKQVTRERTAVVDYTRAWEKRV